MKTSNLRTTKAVQNLFKAIRSDVRKLANTANAVAKSYFAPYLVLDEMGTRQLCWTMKDAKDWLSYMGNTAFICETYDYSILTARIQG